MHSYFLSCLWFFKIFMSFLQNRLGRIWKWLVDRFWVEIILCLFVWWIPFVENYLPSKSYCIWRSILQLLAFSWILLVRGKFLFLLFLPLDLDLMVVDYWEKHCFINLNLLQTCLRKFDRDLMVFFVSYEKMRVL